MRTLHSYRKSPINIISIKYGSERVSFNLATELRIDINSINDELKKQPSYYGFCLLLHKKLLTRFETAKMQRTKMWGRLYKLAKSKNGSNGRLMSDDASKAWVECHAKYIKVTETCIKAKDDADQIYSCLKAFEQRKDLLQSISSNARNQL